MNPTRNPLNHERVILNITSARKIQAEWKDLALATTQGILNHASSSSVISIYLRGSVAVGKAVANISDIDFTVITQAGSHSTCWRDMLKRRISCDYGFVRCVDISLYEIGRVNPIAESRFKPSIAFSVRTQSLLIWGKDLSEMVPFYRADKNTALAIFNEKIPVLLYRLVNDKDLYWCKRQVIRLAAYVTMLRKDYYTRDIFLIADDLCEIMPLKQKIIRSLRDDVIYCLDQISRDMLEEIMWELRKTLIEEPLDN